MIILNPQEIHLWRVSLLLTATEEQALASFLSPDEKNRAARFRFPHHRRRFIAARGILRRILSDYLAIAPGDIRFSYQQAGKPYLADSELQFNLSHSHEMAVYAITKNNIVGIDIEKIRESYTEAVAKRFFSPQEYAQLQALIPSQRAAAFYRIWARKEALIKALGEGLRFPLSHFSVSLGDDKEMLNLDFNGGTTWYLESFVSYPEYQSAFATQQQVKKIIFF